MNVHHLQPVRRPAPSVMSKLAKAQHKAAVRSLGYALTLGDSSAWAGFTIVAMARLTLKERAALTFSTLTSMDTETAQMTVSAALGESGAGMPFAAFDGVMGEAAFWADMADPAELDAYCLASFNRMSRARQAAFLNFVQRRSAA